MNGGWLRAAGARRQCAPTALTWRFWAAPQLHRFRVRNGDSILKVMWKWEREPKTLRSTQPGGALAVTSFDASSDQRSSGP